MIFVSTQPSAFFSKVRDHHPSLPLSLCKSHSRSQVPFCLGDISISQVPFAVHTAGALKIPHKNFMTICCDRWGRKDFRATGHEGMRPSDPQLHILRANFPRDLDFLISYLQPTEHTSAKHGADTCQPPREIGVTSGSHGALLQ